MATRTESLRIELEGTRSELAQYQTALDAERRRDAPRRDEQTRLRALIEECSRAIAGIEDDLAFEAARYRDAAAVARRARARERRDAALEGAASVSVAFAGIAAALEAAIAQAGVLSEVANTAAGHAAACTWAHHEGDTVAAANAAGNAVGLVFGTDRHAFAIAALVRELTMALPPSLADRLSLYFTINHTAFSGRQRVTINTATQHAQSELRYRLGGLFPPEPMEPADPLPVDIPQVVPSPTTLAGAAIERLFA